MSSPLREPMPEQCELRTILAWFSRRATPCRQPVPPFAIAANAV